MTSSTLSTGLRQRLIQQLAAKRGKSGSLLNQGFTLIELLVVVIIVGILAGVSIPNFLSQSEKAKSVAAKSLVSSALKECQVYLVDPTGTFTQTVGGTPQITLAPDKGSTSCSNTQSWTATITGGGTFTAALTATGAVTRTCTGTVGCTSSTW